MNTNNIGDCYQINNTHEPYMPIVFVLDMSDSMKGLPIVQISELVNSFKEQLSNNPKAVQGVEISVIGFNDSPTVIQDWSSISEMKPVFFSADGGTNISAALEKAVNILNERSQLYEDAGVKVLMPLLILITDGYGGDVTEIANDIKQHASAHKMELLVLTTKEYNKKTITELAGNRIVFKLENGNDFVAFFDFLYKELKPMSEPSIPGDQIFIEPYSSGEGPDFRIPNLDTWLAE